MSNTVNNQIPFVPENTLDPAAGLNASLQAIDALMQLAVLAIQNDPPVSPTDGDRYIVGVGTGAWAGKDDQVAMWIDNGAYWQFNPARFALNLDDGYVYARTSGWAVLSGALTGPIYNTTAELVRGIPRDVTSNISGNALTVDYNNGDIQYATLTAAGTAITFSNLPVGGRVMLILIDADANNPDVSTLMPLLNGTAITFGKLTIIIAEALYNTTVRYAFGGTYSS